MREYKGIIYRPATIKDIPGLVYFLSNITDENHLHPLIPHDIALSAEVFKNLMLENEGAILVALKDDILVGAIVLGKSKLWWSSKFEFLTDLVMYVAPKYRRKFNIQGALLEFSKDFANELGMPLYFSLVDPTENLQKRAKYLNIKGFKTIGMNLLYVPKEE